MTSRIMCLEDRCVLSVRGSERVSFLQGLITADMTRIEKQGAGYGALLSPQGKLLYDFFLFMNEDVVFIDVSTEQDEALLKRLSMYKLHADVQITNESNSFVVCASIGEVLDPLHTDPRLSDLGGRGLVAKDIAPSYADSAAYDLHRISLGVPEGGKDYTFGTIFTHDGMLDLLGGVDFTKGCYVGQEVVSRVYHRGTARKRFMIVEAIVDLPEFGSAIFADDKQIGVIGSSAGHKGLALIRTDRLPEDDTPIMCDGIPVSLSFTKWFNADEG